MVYHQSVGGLVDEVFARDELTRTVCRVVGLRSGTHQDLYEVPVARRVGSEVLTGVATLVASGWTGRTSYKRGRLNLAKKIRPGRQAGRQADR